MILYSKLINSFDKDDELEHKYCCSNVSFLSKLSFAELTLNPPEGIIAGPLEEDNFFEWEAYIAYVIIVHAYRGVCYCYICL